jgi:hypothetical protein
MECGDGWKNAPAIRYCDSAVAHAMWFGADTVFTDQITCIAFKNQYRRMNLKLTCDIKTDPDKMNAGDQKQTEQATLISVPQVFGNAGVAVGRTILR